MLQALEVRQFRCHRQFEAEFQPGWNVILGPNGEGKSSLLEAIYYLGRLKSFRTTQTRELIQWQEKGFHVSLRQKIGPADSEELAVRWERGTRVCFLNRQPVDKLVDFWGRIPLVLLASDDQWLVRGPAGGRQQWLDSLIAYGDSRHFSLVQRYNQVVRQRNRWLRVGQVDSGLEQALRVQVTDLGQLITRARRAMVGQLVPILQDLAVRLLTPDRALGLEYRSSFTEEAPDWDRMAEGEKRLGRTLLGPHRDEITLTMRGQSLARYGSEGEQRLASLLLRLTEVHAIRRIRQRWPLLLLDDVLSPLDVNRQTAWTREIPKEVQVIFATTARPSDFAIPANPSVWELRSGALHPL